MKTQTKAVAYGIAALALAGVVIFSGTTMGVLPLANPGFNPGSSALLSVLLTDPPSVPERVSALYVTYTGLSIHVVGLGDGGWVTIGGQGTLETLGLVNLTQTISSSSVPMGTYNMISLTISSAQVEFMGKNYSATVNSGKLTIPIVGGLKLNTSGDAAAVIDIQPTILNLGNQSSPEFIVSTGAKALQVPNSDVRPDMRGVGNRSSLGERPWFKDFTGHSDNLTVGSVSLTHDSFNLSLSNPTDGGVTVMMIIVTQAQQDFVPMNALGLLAGSLVFMVNGDGTITPVGVNTGESHGMNQLRSSLASAGYELKPSSWATFNFEGTFPSTMEVTAGSSYQVVVMGDHLLASTTVQAS